MDSFFNLHKSYTFRSPNKAHTPQIHSVDCGLAEQNVRGSHVRGNELFSGCILGGILETLRSSVHASSHTHATWIVSSGGLHEALSC